MVSGVSFSPNNYFMRKKKNSRSDKKCFQLILQILSPVEGVCPCDTIGSCLQQQTGVPPPKKKKPPRKKAATQKKCTVVTRTYKKTTWEGY